MPCCCHHCHYPWHYVPRQVWDWPEPVPPPAPRYAAVVNLETVVAVTQQVPGVADCHAVRARGTRHRVRVDLHVLVDGAMLVDSAHAVAKAVARAVQAHVPAVIEVLVHLGPVQSHHAHQRPEQRSGEVR